jgi:uncharacterized glyoxalase superfamily protein PhnB
MPVGRSSLSTGLSYRDPRAAIAFLEKAFGFDAVMVIEGPDGSIVHAELSFGDSTVMLGGEWDKDHRSPASLDGKNTQSVHIHIATDVDAHCARAKAAGADVHVEPETQFYGDRTYRCRDLEGHVWTVGQTVAVVTREEAEAVTGLKITGWT